MYEMIMLVLLGGLFFWLLMLTDWYFHEPAGMDRTIWLYLIVLMNVVGPFAYLCLRYRFNRRKTVTDPSEEAPAEAEKYAAGGSGDSVKCMEE